MTDRIGPDDFEREIERLLAEAAGTPPRVPDGLAARMLGDAYEVQADRREALAAAAAATPAQVARPRAGLWRQFLDAVGGWPSVAGLASVAVAGVWIGISPPAILTQQAAGLGFTTTGEDSYLVDVTSAFDTLAPDGLGG